MNDHWSIEIKGEGVNENNEAIIIDRADALVKALQAAGFIINKADYEGCGGETVLPL